MSQLFRRRLSRSVIAAYLCICAALLLLLALTMWGTYRELEFFRDSLLALEIDQLQSHAQRTAGRIERNLAARGTTSLDKADLDSWLLVDWQREMPRQEGRLYAAVLKNDGQVLLHTDPAHRGKRLPRNWYNRVLRGVGGEVVETRSPVLAEGELAYDVRVPIELDGREVGEYHAGLSVDWFEKSTAGQEAAFVRQRSLVVAGVALVVLLATIALYYIATHSITLRRAVDSASLERATEVGKLAAGLAHEIRNPLHAIRLNLHTFRRGHEQLSELPRDEITALLEQSAREIDRIEQLMQQLVRFATPDNPRHEVVDLTSALRDVVEFIKQEMLDNKIELETRIPDSPIRARMDQGRLRQIMLNLLQNAQQAMQDGGRVEIRLSRRRGRAEIEVADNGPGIFEEDRLRIFEPFYSTRPDGTGLGLALVKRFVDEVGGKIQSEPNLGGGTTFRISLRETSSPRTA